MDINNIRINCDLFTLLKNKQLETTIYLEGFEKNGILSDAIIKTYSAKTDNYKNIFSHGYNLLK